MSISGTSPGPSREPVEVQPGRPGDRGLSVWYGSSLALRDITIEIPRNRITALIGPSGAARAPCSAASTG